jgi:translation initiation factor 1
MNPVVAAASWTCEHRVMSRLFAGTPFDRPAPCETCGKPPADCRCLRLPDKKGKHPTGGQGAIGKNRLDSGLVLTPKNSNPPADQIAKIRIEKRKGNRMVTVINGLEHPGNDLDALCGALKKALGVGGSVQGRSVELQGDHGEAVRDRLIQAGFKARVVS